MLSGIHAQDGTFLSGLNRIESLITKANQSITSGIRVSKPSDDPSAVSAMLQYQAQIDHLTQTQTNLSLATSDASAADSALQSATSLIDNISSLGSQGLTLSATADTRTILGQQVQQLQQQLVSIANTSVRGNYIFGGDTPGIPPYSADPTNSIGVVQSPGSSNTSTRLLSDSSGSTRPASLTAGQIFDTGDASSGSTVITDAALTLNPALDSTAKPGISQSFTFTIPGQTAPLTATIAGTPGGYTTKAALLSAVQTAVNTALSTGTPALPAGSINAAVDSNNSLQFTSSSLSFTTQYNSADDTAHDSPAGLNGTGDPGPDNIFAAVNYLSKALLTNNVDAIQIGISALKLGNIHLQTANAFYGNVGNWIDAATTRASAQTANLSTALSQLKDTDLPSAITAMTAENTALQAAISAHASLSTKTLFDYLG